MLYRDGTSLCHRIIPRVRVGAARAREVVKRQLTSSGTMGAARAPSWRFIIPMLAAIAAIAALTALTTTARPSVLIEDKMAEPRPINPEEQPPKPAAKKMVSDLPQIPGMGQIDQKIDPAVNKAAASKMFKYLSKESYTPADEKKYLAEQLGVKATDKVAVRLTHSL